MSKTETKIKILEAGAELIHRNGFNNTGLNDILKLAGVPKGSFYFYFNSKDDFGLALIDHYVEMMKDIHRKNGVDKVTEPVDRMFALFDSLISEMRENEYTKGCPIGNLVQEMSDLNEDFRAKLNSVFANVTDFIARCLEEGREQGVIKFEGDAGSMAGFIFNSYQGAMMRAKLVKNDSPFDDLKVNLDRLLY
ncbi:MAG: TetR family transcriptional regulator C-terminal domain-containing protein [Deferribacterales bacterium]